MSLPNLEESKLRSHSANVEHISQHLSSQDSVPSLRAGERVSLEPVAEKLELEKQELEKELTEVKAALESKTKAGAGRAETGQTNKAGAPGGAPRARAKGWVTWKENGKIMLAERQGAPSLEVGESDDEAI